MFRLQVVLAKLVVLFGVGQVLADTSAGAVPTASGLPPGVESASTDPVRWLPDADGNWRDEENWSSFPDLPGANDDVIIDVGGATVRTVTIDNTSPTVHGLQCEENLNLATGYLRIAAGGGFVNGALSLDGAGLIVQGGGVFTASGATDLTRYGSLRATSGGTLSLPNLQSASTAYHKDLFLSADGEASGSARLDLSELTTVTSTFTEKLYVDALNGGTLDLSSFLPIRSNRLEIKANSGGKIHLGGMTDNQGSELNVVADGVGSEVDLSNLSRFTCGNTKFCPYLTVRNGGRILLPDTLTELDAIDLTIGDGALPTGQLASYTNADLRVEQGAVPSFERLTVLDNSTVRVYHGSVLSVPNVEEVNFDRSGSRYWEASGVSEGGRPSLLDLSSVFEVDTRAFSVGAYQGAKVDLRSLHTLQGGRINIYSQDEGSVMDLSGLVSLTTTPDSSSVMMVSGGGTILLPESFTRIEGLAVVAGRGTIPLQQVRQLVDAKLVVSEGTELTLDNLTSAYDAGFRAIEGKLSLPGLTTLSMPDRGFQSFQAEGKQGVPETVLDLSSLKTISSSNWGLWVYATENARIDVSSLTNVSRNSLQAVARGEGAVVDLSGLTTFRGGGYYGVGEVEISNGGRVIFPETLHTLERVKLHIGRGTITTEHFTHLKNGSLYIDEHATVSFPSLVSVEGCDRLFTMSFSTLTLPSLETLECPLVVAQLGSRLDLSAVKTIPGNGWKLEVEAVHRSTIDLSGLANIPHTRWTLALAARRADATIDVSALASTDGGRLFVSAVGDGHLVDLSSLTDLSGNSEGKSAMGVNGDSVIQLSDSAPCEVSDTDISLRHNGIVKAQNLRFQSGVTLYGNGTVEADVVNLRGVFGPGDLLVEGNFTQEELGKVEIAVNSPDNFSSLVIRGDARLDGTLGLQIDDQLDVLEDMELSIISIAGTRHGMFAGLPQSSVVFTDSQGDELYLSYLGGDGNDVVLTGVPEPSTLILLSTATLAAIAYGWRRRRRTETLAARP